MKKLPLLLMLLALLPARLYAFDNTYYRSLAAMPLAVDACSRSGVPDDQLGRFALQLNDANVPPPQFVETVRYAPIALQQPDFFPFVDNEISQGVTGAALVTAINGRLPRYGVTVRRIETTPAWVLSDNYIPRNDSSSSRREVYDTRYTHPRYDRRSMQFLIEMPLAVARVSGLDGIREDDLGRFCGSLNRGYLPPEQFIDTVRYAPAVFVERPDFVPFIEAQIGNGVLGIQLYDTIYPRLPSYSSRSIAFTPDYVLNDQYYIPQPVRTRFEQAQLNGGYPQQAYGQTYVPQPAIAQPVYTPQPVYTQQPAVQPSYAQQRGNRGRQPRAIAQPSFVPQRAFVPQPGMAQNPYVAPQVARIPPGQAKKAERMAVQQQHGNGHARGQGQVFQQPIAAPPPMASAVPPVARQEHGNGNGHAHGRGQVQQTIVAPPPMASAVPAQAPAPVFVPPPAQNNGQDHGRGPGGQGPPGQQKEKDKGGKGHGKD